jgi:LacI family transcriptional regulator
LLMLQRQRFPFVVVDPREPPPDGIACVAAMHAAGAKQATEHLLQLGHRRIGAIAGSSGWYATEERLIGFRAALAGAGILLDPQLIVYSDWRIPRGMEAADELLSLPDPPTAIFGFNDNVAIGALHAATARGLSVPRDLSIVGFDDTEQAMIVMPQLTSVRQPLAELGRMGVSLLVRLLERQRVDALRIELATKLVVRDSTAPPRG